MKLLICIAQINYRSDDIGKHIERLKEIIRENRSSDLIVFPELILHGHPSIDRPEGMLYRRVKQYYRSIRDQSKDIFRYIKNIDARVIIGELQGLPGMFYNCATYADRTTLDSYRKTHVHWTENFIPGRRLNVFNSPLGKIGINICFDAAFPEVWRVAALKGALVVVNISAVPRTFSVDYMWLRMKSAALNNQVFVIYANRPGDYFAGHSAVFDPRGGVIASAGTGETIFSAEIDLDDARAWRKDERIYENRRPLLYRDITKQRTGGRHPVRDPLSWTGEPGGDDEYTA
ncbi:MAG: carbon-nitrogen hydrolase family protein [Nitrospiraceae bacterium]|nr:MAG: carbon-nitrogen hydrolase family protein [Nitrospiraceae bacterium]